MALWLKDKSKFSDSELINAAAYLKTARPSALNLQYEVDRVVSLVRECCSSGKNAYFDGESK
jgi:methylthioribose-1-phosphate isomerase